MGERITEFEENIVRRFLRWELFNLRGKVCKEQEGSLCRLPVVEIFRIDRKTRLYGIVCGNYTEKYYIPEAYFQVMDDIENGRILQTQTDPSLRIKYTKTYEAYEEDSTVNPSTMEGGNKTEMQRKSINQRYRTFDDFLRDLKDDYKMGITIFLYSRPDLRKRARATKPCDYFKLYNEIKKLYFEMIESERYKERYEEFLRKHTQHA